MKRLFIGLMLASLLRCAVNAQEISVVTEERPPYNYTENDKLIGIATEIVRATLAKAGVNAEFHSYSWARAYQDALEEPNVLIYTIVRDPEREALFKWIGPLVPSVKIFLYKLKKRPEIVINALEDAKKYKIGVTQTDAMHQYLLNQGFEAKKQLDIVTRDEQSLEKLFLERIDLLVEGELSLPLRTKALHLPFAEIEPAFLLAEWKDVLYMALSLQTPDNLVARVKTAFDELKAAGAVDAIIGAYLTTAS